MSEWIKALESHFGRDYNSLQEPPAGAKNKEELAEELNCSPNNARLLANKLVKAGKAEVFAVRPTSRGGSPSYYYRLLDHEKDKDSRKKARA